MGGTVVLETPPDADGYAVRHLSRLIHDAGGANEVTTGARQSELHQRFRSKPIRHPFVTMVVHRPTADVFDSRNIPGREPFSPSINVRCLDGRTGCERPVLTENHRVTFGEGWLVFATQESEQLSQRLSRSGDDVFITEELNPRLCRPGAQDPYALHPAPRDV